MKEPEIDDCFEYKLVGVNVYSEYTEKSKMTIKDIIFSCTEIKSKLTACKSDKKWKESVQHHMAYI